jgi:hypothetical protein
MVNSDTDPTDGDNTDADQSASADQPLVVKSDQNESETLGALVEGGEPTDPNGTSDSFNISGAEKNTTTDESLLEDLGDISDEGDDEVVPTFLPGDKSGSKTDGSTSGSDPKTTDPKSNRNLIIILAGSITAFVLAVVCFVLWIFPGVLNNSDGTQTGPILTPVTPIENTDLAKAIPTEDGIFAMVEQTIVTSWQAQSPVREYAMVYRDNDTASAIEFNVTVAQWTASKDAKKAFDNLKPSSGDITDSGDVVVDDLVEGQFINYTDSIDSTLGVVLWQNGTVVIQARGPKDLILNFYQGYSL